MGKWWHGKVYFQLQEAKALEFHKLANDVLISQGNDYEGLRKQPSS